MKYLLTFISLVILCLGIYIWYSVNSFGTNNQKSIQVFNNSNCNLQESKCVIDLNGDNGTIDISPRPFYLNERINIKIVFPQKRKRKIQIDLKGLDMDMGFNRFSLKSIDSLIYEVSFNLPTCTKSYMPWLMGIFKSEETINTYKFLAKKRTQ